MFRAVLSIFTISVAALIISLHDNKQAPASRTIATINIETNCFNAIQSFLSNTPQGPSEVVAQLKDLGLIVSESQTFEPLVNNGMLYHIEVDSSLNLIGNKASMNILNLIKRIKTLVGIDTRVAFGDLKGNVKGFYDDSNDTVVLSFSEISGMANKGNIKTFIHEMRHAAFKKNIDGLYRATIVSDGGGDDLLKIAAYKRAYTLEELYNHSQDLQGLFKNIESGLSNNKVKEGFGSATIVKHIAESANEMYRKLNDEVFEDLLKDGVSPHLGYEERVRSLSIGPKTKIDFESGNLRITHNKIKYNFPHNRSIAIENLDDLIKFVGDSLDERIEVTGKLNEASTNFLSEMNRIVEERFGIDLGPVTYTPTFPENIKLTKEEAMELKELSRKLMRVSKGLE